MFEWEKLGQLFEPAHLKNESWMKEFAQSPSVVVQEDCVRVYFCSRPAPDANGQYQSLLASLDLDRNDLRKVLRVCSEPLLSLGSYGTFDEFGTNPISVIQEGDQLRVYYAGWTRCESVPINGAIGVAISRDQGRSFQRLGDGPVIPYSPDEPFMMGSPRIRKFGERWILWYVAGKEWLRHGAKPEPVYKIRMAWSEDGLNWEKHGKNLIEDRLGPDECQACADVLYRDGKYHMFFSYRHSHNYKSSEGGYRIGYASSPDMLNWTRNDELAGMQVSPHGWDSEMVCYPHVFEVDGTTYMIYQGNQMGRSGIGLARLRSPQDWSAS